MNVFSQIKALDKANCRYQLYEDGTVSPIVEQNKLFGIVIEKIWEN